VDEDAQMSAARREILDRIAAAVRDSPETAPVSRDYRRDGALSASERVARFCERTGDYRADVRRVEAEAVAAAIEAACREHGARRVVVPTGLPSAWRPAGVDLVDDEALTPRELDGLDGVVTGCTVAVAETGTIVLAAGPHEGRRALTLVPDLHVCVVEESRIVELVPEATAVLEGLVARERRPLTLVSGPSATSDIELSRVEGVHGPRTLVVLVVAKEHP
jgi:L-lactate dehydrogenase complex protein LldG